MSSNKVPCHCGRCRGGLVPNDKGPKYDVSTTATCPLCNEAVFVGTAGPKGLEQHKGKKRCLTNIEKRRKDKKEAKTLTLFSFLQCQDKETAPTTTETLWKEGKQKTTAASLILVHPSICPLLVENVGKDDNQLTDEVENLFRLRQTSQSGSDNTSVYLPGIQNNLIEMIENDEAPTRIAVPTQKVSAHARKRCSGAYLELPAGILPYITLHILSCFTTSIHYLGLSTLLDTNCLSNQSTALDTHKIWIQIAAMTVSGF